MCVFRRRREGREQSFFDLIDELSNGELFSLQQIHYRPSRLRKQYFVKLFVSDTEMHIESESTMNRTKRQELERMFPRIIRTYLN